MFKRLFMFNDICPKCQKILLTCYFSYIGSMFRLRCYERYSLIVLVVSSPMIEIWLFWD
jgi:hypothetical protein